METVRKYSSNWADWPSVPQLEQSRWSLMAVPAAVLAVMAILQIISFGHFRDWIDSVRIGWPTGTAICLIIAELWAAVSLLRVPLNGAFRFIGVTLALLVTGWWFVENMIFASQGGAGQLPNSGYFGKYLAQSPGWWTILEAAIMMFWVIYAAELLKWRTDR